MRIKKILLSILAIYFLNFHLLPLDMVAAENGNESVEEWFEKGEGSEDFNQETEVEVSDEPVGVSAGDVIRSIFALLFVITLLLLVLKWLQKKTSQITETKAVKNLGGTGLGNHRSVQFVQIGNRILVLGVGENVTLLKEISDPHEVDAILQNLPKAPGDVSGARSLLQRFGFFPKEKRTMRADRETSFHHELQKQLKDIVLKRKQVLDKGRKKEWNRHE